MKAFLIAALLCCVSTFAQAPATNAALRRPGNAPIVSPAIAEDGKVTFRLRAAKANEVVVQGQWKDGRAAMTKGTNDVWSVTVGPIEPGVWEYSFNVDGVTMIDPANVSLKPMREPRTSILHIPGGKIWDFADVPHGTVNLHTYRSKVVGKLRELAVYTPPGYVKGSKKYPTLYLQHGSGDNQATWTAHGKAHWIIDNLIAQKKAEPMVVVMMDGHAATSGAGGFNNNTDTFEKDLLQEVMPFVESNYRVKSGAANRGIVGLSMGGGQSLTIGLKHMDKFAWVGGFSAATPNKDVVESAITAPGADKKLKLLWIACGKDDFLLRRNEEFIAFLKEKNFKHDWELTPGGHTWPVWRDYLSVFLPKLFR